MPKPLSEQRKTLWRRSGIAVCLVAELLDNWKPDWVFHIGLGLHHEEIDVMQQPWPDAKFLAWEPHPWVVKQSQEKYPGQIIEAAVSDYSGKGILHAKKRHTDGSSLFPHAVMHTDREDYEEVKIKVVTLDSQMSHIEQSEHPLMWIDCEGAELQVLRGGEKALEKAEIINIEMTGSAPGIGWSSQESIHDWLMDHGFMRQWVHTFRISSGQYDAIYVKPHLFKPEFCCCPCWRKK